MVTTAAFFSSRSPLQLSSMAGGLGEESAACLPSRPPLRQKSLGAFLPFLCVCLPSIRSWSSRFAHAEGASGKGRRIDFQKSIRGQGERWGVKASGGGWRTSGLSWVLVLFSALLSNYPSFSTPSVRIDLRPPTSCGSLGSSVCAKHHNLCCLSHSSSFVANEAFLWNRHFVFLNFN